MKNTPKQVCLKILSTQFESIYKRTLRPYVRLTATQSTRLNLWSSKLGGLPYLPKGEKFPTHLDGKPLLFLGQINFEEMPVLEDFPKTGILQFYIGTDELYGMNFENKSKSCFRVIYHGKIDPKECQTYDMIAPSTTPSFTHPLGSFSQSFSVKFQELKMAAFCSDLNDSDYEELEGLEKFEYEYCELVDRVFEDDAQCANGELICHQIGGYPSFIQGDPREALGETNKRILLLQIDSDPKNGIEWGDAGRAQFFISHDDLKKMDFSRVLFDWACL